MGLKKLVDKIVMHPRYEQVTASFWALLGLAGPTFLQLIYMIVAARVLGAELTGNFFLIVSVALIGSSFVGLGAGGLVMRDTARDATKARVAFGQAQAMSYLTFPILLPFVVMAAWFVTKGEVPLWIIVAVAASDLLAARMITTSWSLFIALELQLRASLLICTMPLARLGAISITVFIPEDQNLAAFAVMYFIASFSVLLGVLTYVRSRIGGGALSLKGFDRSIGVSFSLTWLNSAIQTESDKLLLGFFTTPSLVAVYSIATRLMDGAAMPPRALRVSIQSRLFREGEKGHLSPYRLTLKILPLVIVYGVCAWVGFWLLAPVFVVIFGSEFSALASILPVLGALPLVRAISDYGAEVFMASDRPAIQAYTQTFVTLLRVGLGFLLIGTFYLEGAVATAVLVSSLSATILWVLAWAYSRAGTGVES